ncbi:hypothetical protein DQ04_14071000 [Trypanosoma grayi]|uniref:hypothetical protein n=1 Tax=Trypanosoma grayi TaxID=71804 RepID=UPI0004F4748E|nr:hypothetical protein DQ04_14071000 [Trypanosoma grayi]KEG06408.1 hypothetical protein DQ04_14071000 [Trypanosoma grayi]
MEVCCTDTFVASAGSNVSPRQHGRAAPAEFNAWASFATLRSIQIRLPCVLFDCVRMLPYRVVLLLLIFTFLCVFGCSVFQFFFLLRVLTLAAFVHFDIYM